MKTKQKTKTKTKPLNRKLVAAIIAEMEKEPLRVDMSNFTSTYDSVAPCGTTACIAGFAVALSRKWKAATWRGKIQEMRETQNTDVRFDIELEARKALRITGHLANRLFYAGSWPEPFRCQYVEAYSDDRAGETAIVIARLRHLLRTGR